jgi:hypothetical protein
MWLFFREKIKCQSKLVSVTVIFFRQENSTQRRYLPGNFLACGGVTNFHVPFGDFIFHVQRLSPSDTIFFKKTPVFISQQCSYDL